MRKRNGIFFALKFILTKFPGYFAATFLYHLGMECGSAVHNVWVYYLVIGILASGQHAERLLLVVLGLCGYAAVTGRYFAWYEEKYKPLQEERLSSFVKSEVLERAAHLDLEVYDDPAFYNETILNLDSAHEKLSAVLHLCMQILGSVSAILLSLAAYIKIGMAYFFILLIFVAVSLFLSRKIAAGQFARKEGLTPWERKMAYFSRLLTQRSSAQDIRLTGVAQVFRRHYEDAAAHMKKAVRKEKTPLALMGFLQNYVIERLILNFGAMAWLAYAAMAAHTIGLTEFVTAFKGVNTIADALDQIFGRYVGKLQEYRLFIGRFREFLFLQGKQEGEREAGNLPVSPQIRLDDVVFCYPGSHKPVIDHLSLCMEQGKRVAVVGRNGAGKSTLVKLLLGLYAPQSGTIFMNGKPADQDFLREYGKHCGILFQQYNLYACSVAHNIALDMEYDPEKVELSLEACGFYQYGAFLPDGIRTEVTKEFDAEGIQLSGGGKQLLASARLYVTRRPFFILDEPSAAMDPRMEREMNRRIWKLTEGITTVIISHRLSMTKNVDQIFYLEDGKIAESGTHEQLCAMGGRYAALWRAQTEKYQDRREKDQTAK
ncbi:MAG TPA: ABC transporter ATP-binding protein/permease [Candidatus Eisenbergiella merdipullorum]|uniref:ABC transporter ATP-binding protein/permease n=1 Tax=Candidatus Eisenbergiella merdipullorum TaxID=2838553 RepID=A0A9D2KZ50_9FIRM|nr:ABC transporter ATP-binding protein/permease [Candidatus Eisenbergiella merdipullorum]